MATLSLRNAEDALKALWGVPRDGGLSSFSAMVHVAMIDLDVALADGDISEDDHDEQVSCLKQWRKEEIASRFPIVNCSPPLATDYDLKWELIGGSDDSC